jgi:hypothetical protein
VRVNLIHFILVFREKNIIYRTMRVNLIHSKLVFFKKNCTKNKHTWKKKKNLFTWTVYVNCTVPWDANEEKQPGAASPKLRAKRELSWAPPQINCVFYITKHNVCCGCFKHRSNHANKRHLRKKTGILGFNLYWNLLPL